MPISTTISVDLLTQTAVLSCTVGLNSIETFTYNKTNNQVTLSARPDIAITGPEFMDFCNQVNIFETAILFNYAPLISATIPFNSTNVTETQDVMNNNWNMVCIFGAPPRVNNYSANSISKIVQLFNRANAKTIDFPEWLVFLTDLNHYRLSVRNYLGL